MTETINHPPHYGGDVKFEPIKIIHDWGLGFSSGNALKYLLRAGRKGPWADDMRKAEWYLKDAYEMEEGFCINRLMRVIRSTLMPNVLPFSFRPKEELQVHEVLAYWELGPNLSKAVEYLSQREYLLARDYVIAELREKGIAT